MKNEEKKPMNGWEFAYKILSGIGGFLERALYALMLFLFGTFYGWFIIGLIVIYFFGDTTIT